MRKWAYEAAPLLLALVLGPKMEVAFRQSLMLSHGNFGIFFERPFAGFSRWQRFFFSAFPLWFVIRLGAALEGRGSPA